MNAAKWSGLGLMVVIFGACGSTAKDDPIPEVPGGEDEPDEQTPCATPTTIPWLVEGNFWTVAWSEIEINVEWTGGHGDYDLGDYVMTLGAPSAVDGKTMFPLRLDGNTTKYAPLWSAIGTDGCGNIYGQHSPSGAPELVFSVTSGQWSGTGFYTDFTGARHPIVVTANDSMVASGYTDRAPYFEGALTSVGYNQSNTVGAGTGCEYFPGYGTICGSDDPGSTELEIMLEYWDAGAGPVGMHTSYDYEDCLGQYCDGRHVEKRVEVYHFGDVTSLPSAYETEPDSYYEPTPLPIDDGELFSMFASISQWDTPAGVLGGSTPPAPAAQIHDWYRFEVTSDMLHPLTLEFYLVWNDEEELDLHLFTAPDHPNGFTYLAEGFTMEMDEFNHAKVLSGSYNTPGPYLIGVVREGSSEFTTNYGIMTFAAVP